jgi:hypothetical protein
MFCKCERAFLCCLAVRLQQIYTQCLHLFRLSFISSTPRLELCRTFSLRTATYKKLLLLARLIRSRWIHFLFHLVQCCATFLHSRHTKYCRRAMAAHQPHFTYWWGGGGDGLWHWLAATTSYKSTPIEKMFYLMFIFIHLYYYIIYFKYIHNFK